MTQQSQRGGALSTIGRLRSAKRELLNSRPALVAKLKAAKADLAAHDEMISTVLQAMEDLSEPLPSDLSFVPTKEGSAGQKCRAAFEANPGISPRQLSAETGVPKATAYTYLCALRKEHSRRLELEQV